MSLYFFSDSAAGPNIDSDIRAWKSFLSKVADEVKKTKVNYKTFCGSAKICMRL